MDFIHRPFIPGETIVAIATPPGEGGIAIIRISGKDALDVAEKIFSGQVKKYLTHTAHFGFVKHPLSLKKIDEALLIVMLGKRSYTGEDTVELQCHGGALASKKVLEAAICAGARPAGPGEFTFKAFMNGKLDLAQAEAVQNLICAKNEKAFEAAGSHLEGKLSLKVKSFQSKLVDIAAIIEAWVDFPEEGLEFASVDEICQQLSETLNDMQKLLATFEDGRKIHYGISLCIIGAPNAGKSSLMNALLEKERAIVTPIAGTTRDVLEDDFYLNGLNLRLIDTAGIRETEEIIEKEGIRRSLKAMENSDLTLLILDASRPLNEEEKKLLNEVLPEKTLVVWNKIDLGHSYIENSRLASVQISATEKLGLEALKSAINELVWQKGSFSKEEVFITSSRHKEALSQSIHSINQVLFGLSNGISPEFLTMDIRKALSDLGQMIGTNISEDIISSIFSRFCIGK